MRRTIAVLAVLTAVSCGDDIAQRYKEANAKLPPSAPPAPVAASPADSAKVGAADLRSWDIDKDGVVLVKYELIYSEKHELHGVPKNEDKREYTLDSDQSLLLTAKSAEDSIKILAANGTLHWKVKIDGGQIKISDNDQNANAYVLTTLSSVTRVTAPDGHLIGTVKYENGKNVMRDGFDKVIDRMPSKLFRPGYGVILIDGISPPERFAMMCEIFDKTRQK